VLIATVKTPVVSGFYKCEDNLTSSETWSVFRSPVNKTVKTPAVTRNRHLSESSRVTVRLLFINSTVEKGDEEVPLCSNIHHHQSEQWQIFHAKYGSSCH
jgi:hypothetical protein